jgi:hypothetical protein
MPNCEESLADVTPDARVDEGNSPVRRPFAEDLDALSLWIESLEARKYSLITLAL